MGFSFNMASECRRFFSREKCNIINKYSVGLISASKFIVTVKYVMRKSTTTLCLHYLSANVITFMFLTIYYCMIMQHPLLS